MSDEGTERVTLHGGPGGGDVFTVGTKWDQLKWNPTEEREKVAARMEGRPPNGDPIIYRRSLRTRTIFVYQP